MGESSLYGFKKNDKYKITYCHAESRLELLGKNIVDFIANTSIEEMNNIYDKIILVEEYEDVPKELAIKYKQYSEDDCNWGCVLRDVQGHLEYYKKDLIHIVDNGDFSCIYDVDWIYVINLDRNELEIYYSTRYANRKDLNILRATIGVLNKKVFEKDNDYILLKTLQFKSINDGFNELLEKYDKYLEKTG